MWGQKAASIFIWCPWKQINLNLGECPFKERREVYDVVELGKKCPPSFSGPSPTHPWTGNGLPVSELHLIYFGTEMPYAFVGRLSEYSEFCFDIGSIFLNI